MNPKCSLHMTNLCHSYYSMYAQELSYIVLYTRYELNLQTVCVVLHVATSYVTKSCDYLLTSALQCQHFVFCIIFNS